MLTPKQKAILKSHANAISQRHLLGKAEIDDAFLQSIDVALEAHELIKVGLLQTASYTPKEVGQQLEEALGCDVVQIIGKVIVIYRKSKKHPRNLI